MASIIDRIREWFHERTRSSEDASEYDGFLSYSAEWHAAAVGALLGIVTGITQSPEVAFVAFLIATGKAKASNGHLKDAAKEVAYTGGSFVIFFVLTTFAGTL